MALWLGYEIEDRGLSQRKLAKMAGTSHTTISEVVSGIREPTWEFCIKIADALHVPRESLLRMAGHLPPEISPERRREFDEVAEQLAGLPKGPIRDEAMAAIRAIARSAVERQRERERAVELKRVNE